MRSALEDVLALKDLSFEQTFAEQAGSRYFNTAGGGQVPPALSEAIARLSAAYDRAGAMSRAAQDATSTALSSAREALAACLNAEADDIALTDSATSALQGIAAALCLRPGATIVIGEDEHPSLEIPFLALARHGARIVRVDPSLSPEAQATPNSIAIAALSHTSYRTGRNLHADWPSYLRQRETLLVVDATQTIGLAPVSVRALDCVVLVGNGHKWLHGPLGTGFIWAGAAAMQRLRPGGGWRSIADPLNHHTRHRDARAFEGGTLNFPAIAGLAAATHWQCNAAFRNRLTEARRVRAEAIVTPLRQEDVSLAHENAGLVYVSAAPGRRFDAHSVAEAIWRTGAFDVKAFSPAERPRGALRISTSPFNTIANCEHLGTQLAEALRVAMA